MSLGLPPFQSSVSPLQMEMTALSRIVLSMKCVYSGTHLEDTGCVTSNSQTLIKGAGLALGGMVRVGFSEEVTFELRLE